MYSLTPPLLATKTLLPMRETTSDRLRRVALTLRTKPIPIKDLIPLLQEAADEIDSLNSILGGEEVNDHINL